MILKTVGLLLFVALVFLITSNRTSAQTVTTFYNFNDPGQYGDGNQPRDALVVGPDGSFYGTATGGGLTYHGTVFKITSTGTYAVLHSFADGSVQNDGKLPSGLVLGRDGNFYGLTAQGGSSGNGTIFRITPEGTETVLYSFTAPVFGNLYPPAALVQASDEDFYGTSYGGGTADKGSVFKVTPEGEVTILHSFGDGSVVHDGQTPEAPLIQGSDGNFYGTATTGGVSGFGTVFKITPAGAETVLYSFATLAYLPLSTSPVGPPPPPPAALRQAFDGTFYGTTSAGGTLGDGSVFTITSAGAFTLLHSFHDGSVKNDGIAPNGLVFGSDGSLYGTTESGGGQGYGMAFKITPTGAETILHNYGYLESVPFEQSPESALVLGGDGNFYGTTYGSGSIFGNVQQSASGTVFKISPAGVETVIHQFGIIPSISNAVTSQSALVIGKDGNFYGTTVGGGTGEGGAAFRLTPTGAETLLYSFQALTDPEDGATPNGLIVGSDGNFYGTTYVGGKHGEGTVFKLTPSGAETVLYDFGDGFVDDGALPLTNIVFGSDGRFYGTTTKGGLYDKGTVFKITPAGTETILHSFGAGNANDGFGPQTGLVLGSDGNFYGTTPDGGSLGYGTVFRITPAGAYVTLHSFNGLSDGAEPFAALIQGRDGNFYGTTAGTPSNAFISGTVFKITPSGVLTTLSGISGISYTSLVQGRDGNFYGTTEDGDAKFQGTIFEVTPGGTETVLHSFGDGTVLNDGSFPQSGLIQAPDGNLYGTTNGGGAAFGGTVFMLSLASAKSWTSRSVAAAPDGTARILWTRSDGAAGIWSLSATDTQTVVGPAYGPYADSSGTWTAKAVKVAADGTSRLLWTRSDGAASVWSLDASGKQTVAGPTYGPYPGWSAVAIAAAPDGSSRILWIQKDGVAGLWTLNANDVETKIGPTYGPNLNWTAIGVGAAADGTARILWSMGGGAAGLWAMDAGDALQTVGPSYGPFQDSQGSWSAIGLGTSSDGSSQVLWDRSDGAAGLWTFNAADAEVATGPVYGPYPGFTAAGADASSGLARVLWVRGDRAAGLWSFGADDTASLMGTLYGPY